MIEAKRVRWMETVFDSQLECDWAATFEWLGIRWVFHPGKIHLKDGTEWQPDFLLLDPWGRPEHDVLAEAKGAHDERLWKVLHAEEEFGRKILVLRAGLIPAYSDAALPGACWHGGLVTGEEWVLAASWRDSEPKKLNAHFTCRPRSEEMIYVSAERCLTRYDVKGIHMQKAIGVAA